jgi:hypothetical protein
MNPILEFEDKISTFFGSPYAVAVDCCTHGIELCLRLLKEGDTNTDYQYTCPNWTYLSIPMTFEKLSLDWSFTNEQWSEYYNIGNTNIIDAAVLWRKNSYIPSTIMCVSFQMKKHLSLGKGGVILLDNEEDAEILRQIRYDGRPDLESPWADQNIQLFGYHYQMTYETAEMGVNKFQEAVYREPKHWTWKDYPNLSKYEIFKKGVSH